MSFLAGLSVFVYFYVRYSRLIDARLSGDVFNNSSLLFAAPTRVMVGQPATPAEEALRLRRAGYTEGEGASSVGSYRLDRDRMEIRPGPRSFFKGDILTEGPAALQFRDGKILSIFSLDEGKSLTSYWLEPEIITTLFDQNRAKRRLIGYSDLPKALVDAVVASEDHRFFSHHGVNFYRIMAAALSDLRSDDKIQGGSTLTMQLARNFFLSLHRGRDIQTVKRKLAEIFLAFLLEQRLSKEQIFELYANQIYLGQRGSFSIYGFGEAATAYFNKDVSSLTLPEAALLAGLIRGPSLYTPYRHATRAVERRNYVIRQMMDVGLLTPADAEKGLAAPLGVTRQNVEGTQAPFFVDMVRDQLLAQFSERELLSQSYRVYTTLDLDLQRVASEAVRAGTAEVDQELKKHRRPKNEPPPGPHQPQVALVCIDPHTGALKALVGGRDYGVSQLNHVLARRQPGSSFKPFVYAAALSTAVDGSQQVITPATQLVDEPTTFQFGDLVYEPENYRQLYHGVVTLREALTHSLNVATVQLAELVGYDKVKNVAVSAGFNRDLMATPALALGSYVATPLEVAGAYTIFANYGQSVAPRFILAVNDSSGQTLWRSPLVTRRVLDPRVSYLMVSLLESVVNNGTGAGVRSRGFRLPAAGKTGTSHDGWFAGFTSNLLAVAWVGYDDDRELMLPGASSALPIWTEFMTRAAALPAYTDVRGFGPPPGIVSVPISAVTNGSASGQAGTTRNELFIEGTEPRPGSPQKGITGILGRIFHTGSPEQAGGNNPASPAAALPASEPNPSLQDPRPDSGTVPREKRGGIVKKFLGIFKGGAADRQTREKAPEKRQP